MAQSLNPDVDVFVWLDNECAHTRAYSIIQLEEAMSEESYLISEEFESVENVNNG